MKEPEWNTKHIDPANLFQITRGDKNRLSRYLNQFIQLIPQRVASLREAMEKGERRTVRQLLHQMSPQLQFFGIPGILQPIRRLEHEYETIPMDELKTMVNKITVSLEGACLEVRSLLDHLGMEP